MLARENLGQGGHKRQLNLIRILIETREEAWELWFCEERRGKRVVTNLAHVGSSSQQ